MSSLENRLQVFRQLPLRAQIALIASSRSNPVLSQNQEYITSLEQIHAQCLQRSSPEQRAEYEQAKRSLDSM